MNVKCPSCETVYRVDPTKVPAGGIRARCATCGAILSVQPDQQGQQVAEPVTGGGARSERPDSGPQTPSAFEEPAAIETPVAAPHLDLPEPPETPSTPAVEPRPERPELPTPRLVRPELPSEPTAPIESVPTEPEVPAIGLVRDDAPPAAPSTPEPPAVHPTPEQPDIGPSEPPSLQVPEPTTATPPEPARPRRLSKPFFRPGATPEATPPKSARPSAPVFKPSPEAPPQPATPVPEPPPAPSGGAGPEAPSKKPVNPFLSRDPKQKARRLARALVSDMIVYQPKKRQDAIQSGTLKDDFEEEIQKSWEEYVGQVGEEMAKSTPYWKEALNEILAGGREIF